MTAVPAGPARGRLRARRLQAAGVAARGLPGGAVGNRGRHRAGVSRAVGETMIVLVAAGQVAQPRARPRRGVRDDDRVHRRHRQGRRAHRVRSATRRSSRWGDALRDHAAHERDLHPLRPPLQAGLRVSALGAALATRAGASAGPRAKCRRVLPGVAPARSRARLLAGCCKSTTWPGRGLTGSAVRRSLLFVLVGRRPRRPPRARPAVPHDFRPSTPRSRACCPRSWARCG